VDEEKMLLIAKIVFPAYLTAIFHYSGPGVEFFNIFTNAIFPVPKSVLAPPECDGKPCSQNVIVPTLHLCTPTPYSEAADRCS
jgi:hypothetical protein